MVPDDRDGDFEKTTPRDPAGTAGDRIGPYRLMEKLGEGGMGEVWKAEQIEPMQRVVALKLIKVGMDTRQVIARFEAERQALALMDHPGIARVLDAGETAQGRPYFVMEYVPGEPITEYCDRRRLTTNERLALFQRVCEAVQHAHQKAVIHRDLKPGNILVRDVDGRPSPKIIDFGVAKATSQKLTDKTVYTYIGQFLGTPAYMSPEQAEMNRADVDTRSDVYSLGVLLYELLVGALPFEPQDLLRAGYAEILRILREEEPPRPSTRLSGLGERTTAVVDSRRTRVRNLAGELRGDLDWIAMKALEKDRNRRYDTAAEMARDIQRHLDHEPLLAGPPSAGYRMKKFVRRHRVGVSTATVAILVLAAFSVITSVQARRIAHERDLVIDERERAEAAHLYTLGQNAKTDASAFAYALASLERSDEEHVRSLALEVLSRGPQPFRFVASWRGAHNPKGLAISPDGRWTAVGWTMGGHLRVYPETGGEPVVLEGHAGALHQLEFTPDSRRLISAASDGTVRAWSIPEGELLDQLDLPPGSFVFFGLLDGGGTILLCHFRSGEEATWLRWKMGDDEPELLARWDPSRFVGDSLPAGIDPAGPSVLLGKGKRLVRIPLDRLESAEGESIGAHDAAIIEVYCSPDGSLAVSVDADGDGIVWDLRSRPSRSLRRFRVGEAPIGAGFSPDGQKLAVGHWGGTILLDLRSPLGTQALELKPYDTHWGFVPVFHPRRPWLLVSGTMGAVVAWPLDREYPLHFPDIPFAYSLAFTPDGKRLLMAKDGAILLFPLSGDPEDPPRPVLQLEQNSFNSLQLDAEGRFVLSGIGNSPAGNHSFHLVDLETGVHRSWKEHWFWSAAAKLHPQAKYIAVPNDFTVQGERNLCRILDLRDDSFVDVEFGDEDPVVPWGFDREGFLLLGHAEQIHRVDPSDGTRELLIDGVHRGFQSGYESADRRWLVWRSTTDSLRLTDLESGETRPLELGGHHGSPIGIDPAGRFLALAQGGGVMDIVALDGSLQHRLHGPEGSYTSVAFDPTGHWIAASTTAESDAVRLWRMPHGNSPDWLPREELLELLRPQTSLRVEPDEESPVRYRIVAGEFPGWDPPPTW